MSSVASSAQWTSSRTVIVGFLDRQLGQQRREDGLRPVAALGDLFEQAARRRGDVEKRPKGPRRAQGVAGSPKDPRPAAALLAEPLDENALSNAGLACEENQAPPPADCIGEALVEHRDKGRALEQVELSVLLFGVANSLRHSTMVHATINSFKRRSGKRPGSRLSSAGAAASLHPRECSHGAARSPR